VPSAKPGEYVLADEVGDEEEFEHPEPLSAPRHEPDDGTIT
jgi:hypothetical protein